MLNPSSTIYRLLAGAALFLAQTHVFAEDSDSGETFSITPHGFAGLQSFYVHAYKNQAHDYPHEIFNNSVLNYTFDLNSGKNLSMLRRLGGLRQLQYHRL